MDRDIRVTVEILSPFGEVLDERIVLGGFYDGELDAGFEGDVQEAIEDICDTWSDEEDDR